MMDPKAMQVLEVMVKELKKRAVAEPDFWVSY